MRHVRQHFKILLTMISLKDSIEIHTTPKRVFTWLERLPQEYRSWHPDHVACNVISGSMLEVGSEIECQEYLHGKLHSLKFRMSKVVPNERVEFTVLGMGQGAFEVEPMDDHVRFIAELDIGSDIPIIGRLFDRIFSSFFMGRIEAMKQHMVEEGRNLKEILEKKSPLVLDAA